MSSITSYFSSRRMSLLRGFSMLSELRPSASLSLPSNRAAIHSDWQAVGRDIRQAITKYGQRKGK